MGTSLITTHKQMTIKTIDDHRIARFVVQIVVGAVACFGTIYIMFLMGGTP